MLNQHKILRVLQLIATLEVQPSKSIQHLAKLLETTDRTVYRYLDLIRVCGFDLQRDQYNRFFITTDTNNGIRFTTEEAEYLKELVLTDGKRNKLKDAVLGKIYLASELTIVAEHLVNAKNGRIVEQLAQAIAEKQQIILKRYHSINTETISDRLVEPFGFTENYTTVMAYEIESGKNKTFHLERITAIENTNQSFSFEALHEQQLPDVFGFSYKGEKHLVELELSLKDYLLLKNDYPLTAPFIKYNAKNDCYVLKVEVNDLKPVERFMKNNNR